MTRSRADITRFRRAVWTHSQKHGRHKLPWRLTHTPYRILVSEVMLQQTQAPRVIPFYRAFLKAFPTPSRLARASLSEVLQVWQGLGYNRRAKMLHQAATHIVRCGMPRDVAALEQLPGVGPYTARAIAAFAWNQDVVCVETNIRTVMIHHFFSKRATVSDAAIELALADVLPKGRAREWYAALMDYGAHLKRSGISHNARSAGYIAQRTFRGSPREARGAIVRTLVSGPRTPVQLERLLGGARRAQLKKAQMALAAEGLIEKVGGRYRLAA